MEFFYDAKAKVLNFFSDIRVYKGGIVFFGASSYKIKGNHMRGILNVLKPGDVLLRRYDNYLGTFFIPGYFSHAAIYEGQDNIIHMLGDGIDREDILTFLRCDDVRILRVDDSEENINNAVINAKLLYNFGVEYDYNFDTNCPKKFYCTEFVDHCFGYPVKSILKNGKKILPDDFLKTDYFKTVWTKK